MPMTLLTCQSQNSVIHNLSWPYLASIITFIVTVQIADSPLENELKFSQNEDILFISLQKKKIIIAISILAPMVFSAYRNV